MPPRLNLSEKHLLTFPPTPTTWVCEAKRKVFVETFTCNTPNSGRADQCWACTKLKPKRPRLVWVTYEATCKRIGHTPGEKWPAPSTEAVVAKKAPAVKRKKAG